MVAPVRGVWVVGEMRVGVEVTMDRRPPFCGERGLGLRLRVVRVPVGAGDEALRVVVVVKAPAAVGAAEAESERDLVRARSERLGEAASWACPPIFGVVRALLLPPVGASPVAGALFAAPAAFVKAALSASALTPSVAALWPSSP